MKILFAFICVWLLFGVAISFRVNKEGYVLVPGRGPVPKECVHEVPNGSHITGTY